MLNLQGVSLNVDKPIIGKVSFSQVEKKNRSLTIIANQKFYKWKLKDYAALITSQSDVDNELKNLIIPTVFNIEDIELLSEGDVVEILPNGLIKVFYQRNSRHNLIFVTSRCNSDCIMCPQAVDYNEGNLTELNLKIIPLIDQSTEELALTGGEPTVVGHDLFRLILACKHFHS